MLFDAVTLHLITYHKINDKTVDVWQGVAASCSVLAPLNSGLRGIAIMYRATTVTVSNPFIIGRGTRLQYRNSDVLFNVLGEKFHCKRVSRLIECCEKQNIHQNWSSFILLYWATPVVTQMYITEKLVTSPPRLASRRATLMIFFIFNTVPKKLLLFDGNASSFYWD